jgi:predicted Zn-dependent protease
MASHAYAQSVLRDAEIEQWIDEHAKPLFTAAGLPADEINIFIIGDPTPNAFAAGLNMGLHTGLLTSADTPDQIEGVIAHETGHIAGGHSVRSDEMTSAAMRPIILSLILAAAAIAAGSSQAGIGILGLGQTVGITNALHYSRGQEASADQAAITYLDKTGQSSKGLIEFFGKLRNYQIITGARVNPYLQSHPLANDRMTALAKRASASANYEKTDDPADIERLKLLQAKINGFLQETNVTLRQYPATDQSDPAHYARAVAYYRGSMLDKAEAEIDVLLAEHPDNPYFQELKGQMLFEFGHVEESVAPHRRSVDLAPTQPLLRINLGRALAATEDPTRLPEAVKQLKAALLLERNNSFAWFELARAYGGLGQTAMADLAMAESRFNSGAKGQAAVFAHKAKIALPKGSPEWRQAQDIILAVGPGDGAGISFEPEADRESPQKTSKKPDGEVPDPQIY